MRGPTYLDSAEPGSLREIAKFVSCPKHRGTPSCITKPTANTAVRGPQAPVPEFANHKTPAGPQHAGHFRDRSLGVVNEAKHGHRNDTVESRAIEWQFFGSPLNELHWSGLDLDSPLRGGDHFRVCIEPRYDCTTPDKLQCKRSIAAADVQQSPAGNRTNNFEEELPLQCIGNFAKTAPAPPGVGSGQPLSQLRAAHEAIRSAK